MRVHREMHGPAGALPVVATDGDGVEDSGINSSRGLRFVLARSQRFLTRNGQTHSRVHAYSVRRKSSLSLKSRKYLMLGRDSEA